MITSCTICAQSTNAGDKVLLNGETVHMACLDVLNSNKTSFDEQIKLLEINIELVEKELSDHQRLTRRISNMFNSRVSENLSNMKSNHAKDLKLLNSLRDKRKTILEKRPEDLFNIYSYWMKRPPDWEFRRKVMVKNMPYCNACGEKNQMLHVHHLKPISEGGNHTFENLEVLCEFCHSQEHGGRRFTYNENKKVKGRFERITELLWYAIENGLAVKMTYVKINQERTTRVIHPENIFEHEISRNLCVEGYCSLRQDNRVFAIKRIKKLVVFERK